MTSTITTSVNESALDVNCQDTSLIEALSRLLVPLARLCLVNGITFAAAEDILKRAFVQEAGSLQPDMPVHGTVSRISTATGISRREVTRLIKLEAAGRPTKPSLAAEVFARWTTGVSWRDHEGAPCVLNRQGPAPSFEALSQSITRDIHPRSMLEELIRLGLVSHDEDLDLVSLTRSDYVPRSDSRQMLGFLGDNVGDHLNAAVSNVMHDSSRHLEQSVFADELSAESIEALRPLIMAQWQALRDVMVPAISTYIEADQLAGRTQNQRVRIGLYSFTETATNSDKTGSDQTEDPNQNSNPKENSK